jgi:diaminohydroxyphosphoribosylaminopyrimidine deaminase/5-amino-6-(5-phosphoribosylamino)uracil reductase
MRNKYMAIMVGADTVIADNPQLTCRLPGKCRNPLRIVVDSQARCSAESKVFEVSENEKTLLAVTEKAPADKIESLRSAGVDVVVLPEDKNGRVNLKDLMKELGNRKIDSILLEGGGTLNFSALNAGIVDRVTMFVAPKIVGGKTSKTPVEGEGVQLMANAICLENIEIKNIENDLMITGLVSNKEA